MTNINYNGTLADEQSQSLNRLQEIASRGASHSADRKGPSMTQCISRLDWFSSSILHELRNPVATIYTSAEMLVNSFVGPADMKRLARNMHSAAARMRKLLTEVSDAICGTKPTSEICEIREVIRAASEAAFALTDRPRVQILLDVPRGIEAPLARSRIERVFFNLLNNSFEAMPGGGEVRIRARQAGNYVMVELEDTGPGIPNQIRDRIFHPFVTAGKTNGLGLGLYLSRQAVLEHGGDLWVETASGARFVMRLPRCRAQEL